MKLVSTVTALLLSVAKADELVLQRHRVGDGDGQGEARAVDTAGAEAAAAHEVEGGELVRKSLCAERRRAGRDAIYYMEVQVRFGGVARVAHEAEHLSPLHLLTELHAQGAGLDVRVEGKLSFAHVHHDVV